MIKRKIFLGCCGIGLLACFTCLATYGIPFVQTFFTTTTIKEVNAKSVNEKTIVIDAGHGGYDTGSLAENGTYEKDITLAISLLTGAILKENGYTILYTRESDEVSWSSDNLEDLQTRVSISEEAKAGYYISIHTNASSFHDGASGFEIYLNYENDTITSIATSLQSTLNALSYTQDRGLKNTSENTLYVIDKNTTPSMLIELGFLTDANDTSYLQSEEGQRALANAIASSIMENT